MGVYTPGDPTILISKSGATAELVRLIPVLREFQSPLIGVLGNIRSPLAEQVDVVLDATVSQEADPLGIAPTSSATLAMALGDALASALMLARGFGKEDFARFHPAGQLGRNLLLKVADVMHPMEAVAKVTQQASLREVVILLSEFPMGGACVVDEAGNLEGFITDGDIRRALKLHEDIRGLKASDLMTPNPTCTFPGVTIDEAVRQMEDRPSQIYVLPVVETNSKKCLGLLRLHDVYQPQLL
ncbi:MAG: hypothetical protein B7X06_00935 [Verrucomicrobia bacterium 21-51-4]|nr:MAG: hypothetical protein B7X06_00935 [Verrucomicrobia bacterium 21-51-4]